MTPATVHPIAARGYSVGGDYYERARPGYPLAAVDLLRRELGIFEGTTVVDLGAGTGKLTRLLADAAGGVRLVAIEPVEAMRRHLVVAAPSAQVLAATAEAVPLADGSVDSLVVATAFHWFDGRRALAEIRRVLRPGGALGLVWNNPDLECPWVAEVWGLVGRHRRQAPRNADLRWKAAFRPDAGYTPLAHRRLHHQVEVDLDGLLARIGSISFVADLPQTDRELVLEDVAAAVRTHPDLRGRSRFALPYRTDVYWCHTTC